MNGFLILRSNCLIFNYELILIFNNFILKNFIQMQEFTHVCVFCILIIILFISIKLFVDYCVYLQRFYTVCILSCGYVLCMFISNLCSYILKKSFANAYISSIFQTISHMLIYVNVCKQHGVVMSEGSVWNSSKTNTCASRQTVNITGQHFVHAGRRVG